MEDKRKNNNETSYHLRKSLIALNRALRHATTTGDIETCKEIRKCLVIITRQIKILSIKK